MDEEILAVKTRRDLYEFVRKNPGFHLRSQPGQPDARPALTDGEKQVLAFLRQRVPFRVIAYLMEQEAGTHKEILEQVPVSPSTLSHHLKKMQVAGLIDRAAPEERGYQVTNPKAVARLMATYELATPDQIDTFLRVWGEFRL